MNEIIGQACFSIDVYCPFCDDYFDILDQDDDHEWLDRLCGNHRSWKLFKGVEVTCPECDHKFKLDGIERS